MMARPKSFDEDKVLDAAIDCFSRNGLKSASIRDLADEMGIAGPSLYNAYGCKRALFVKALARYADAAVRAKLAALERAHPAPGAIAAFFAETISDALAGPEARGCMIVNTAMEADPRDAELSALVSGYLGEIQEFFVRNLTAARAASLIPGDLDIEDASRLFVGLLLGLGVLARARPERALLEATVRPALALLETAPRSRRRGLS
ncbi:MULTISPECIES: TetR/AcrR family transcriptional regulator [Rhodomicrobium]|uniref:TetR/AcrR family transcriptional regulator n=1 Tax=Rhodomicrobium TaxID=1068 RepID=UPI001FD90E3D|nr:MULTISPECIES: TetR/AcrR family transcriptional regulator [Rhodomicrobium]